MSTIPQTRAATMSPRERILAALRHEETDRVPVDFGGHRSSGIAAIAYRRLREALGFEPRPIRVYDPVQQLAIIDEDVLERFGIDALEMGRGFALEEEHWRDWTLPDGSPCQMPAWALPVREAGQWIMRSTSGRTLAKMPDGALYFEQCYWPYQDADDLEHLPQALEENMWCAVKSPPGPLVAGPDGKERLAAGARRLRERTNRAIIGLFGGNLLETGQFLYRNDVFFMVLAGNPQHAHEFLDRLVELHLANLERFLAAVGESIDIILFGDDLGMQSGPQISPRMYREFFKPRHARLWKRAKELANVKIMLHCCGGVRPLLDDLIDAGLDAINPVQVSCAGMEPRALKADFGDRITFWGGGCDTHAILNQGTPEDVRRHVLEQTSILRPGGGFVFQQVHNILADIRPENVIAMFDAVRDAG
jgi:uroporphyrinogen decarboxylase